jgi:hypothetical protein
MPGLIAFEHLRQPSGREAAPLCYPPAAPLGQMQQCQPKTFLQHTLTAMAFNLIRLDAWLTGAVTTGSWTSRLARLTQALPAT